MEVDGYWKLKAKILRIPICRKCGERLDKEYQLRQQGKLCLECFKKRNLVKSQVL